MVERTFKEDVVRALMLVRAFRLHAVVQEINPKAVRVAIKVLAHIDNHFALKELSNQEEFDLEIYASKVARIVIEAEEKEKRII